MSFDSIEVSNDGTVPFRSGERIGFSYLVSQKYIGDKATLRVLSGGKEVTRTFPMGLARKLAPVHIGGRQPSYYILAGVCPMSAMGGAGRRSSALQPRVFGYRYCVSRGTWLHAADWRRACVYLPERALPEKRVRQGLW